MGIEDVINIQSSMEPANTPVMETITTTALGMKGKRWTEDEDNQFLGQLANGMSFSEIAAAHQRTIGGVAMRATRHAVDAVKEGMDIEEASAKFGVPARKITKEINKPAHVPRQVKSRDDKQISTKRQHGPQAAILPVSMETNQSILTEIRDLLRVLVDQRQSNCQCQCGVNH